MTVEPLGFSVNQLKITMINKYWEKSIIIVKGKKFVTKRGDRYDIKKVRVIKQK